MEPLDWMGGVSVVRLTVVSRQKADGRLIFLLKHLQLQRCPQQEQEVVLWSEVRGRQRFKQAQTVMLMMAIMMAAHRGERVSSAESGSQGGKAT